MPTLAEIDRVRRILSLWYLNLASPSGDISIPKIGFSRNPRKWHIRVSTSQGEAYPKNQSYPGEGAHRLNASISAVVPYQWVPHYNSDLKKSDQTYRNFLIIGTEAINPPEDIDAAKILYVPHFEGGSLCMNTRLRFLFTKGDITWSPQHHTRQRRQIEREMNVAADIFRQYIAEKLLHRMRLPTQKSGITITDPRNPLIFGS